MPKRKYLAGDNVDSSNQQPFSKKAKSNNSIVPLTDEEKDRKTQVKNYQFDIQEAIDKADAGWVKALLDENQQNHEDFTHFTIPDYKQINGSEKKINWLQYAAFSAKKYDKKIVENLSEDTKKNKRKIVDIFLEDKRFNKNSESFLSFCVRSGEFEATKNEIQQLKNENLLQAEIHLQNQRLPKERILHHALNNYKADKNNELTNHDKIQNKKNIILLLLKAGFNPDLTNSKNITARQIILDLNEQDLTEALQSKHNNTVASTTNTSTTVINLSLSVNSLFTSTTQSSHLNGETETEQRRNFINEQSKKQTESDQNPIIIIDDEPHPLRIKQESKDLKAELSMLDVQYKNIQEKLLLTKSAKEKLTTKIANLEKHENEAQINFDSCANKSQQLLEQIENLKKEYNIISQEQSGWKSEYLSAINNKQSAKKQLDEVLRLEGSHTNKSKYLITQREECVKKINQNAGDISSDSIASTSLSFVTNFNQTPSSPPPLEPNQEKSDSNTDYDNLQNINQAKM